MITSEGGVDILVLLLVGGPHEVVPDDMARVIDAASRWSCDGRLSDAEQVRIRTVWLEGIWQPAAEYGVRRFREIRAQLAARGSASHEQLGANLTSPAALGVDAVPRQPTGAESSA